MNRHVVQSLKISLLLVCCPFAALPALDSKKIKKTRSLTVSIRTFDKKDKPLGYGTGFVISEEGLVATCYHVLEGSAYAVVRFPGSRRGYKLSHMEAVDKGSDLAILSTKVKKESLVLSKSRIEIGDRVLAFGNPKGLEGTVSDGIISSFRVSGREFPISVLVGTKIIQTTAAISPGSSGGPLVNEEGEVVGIMVSKRTDGQSLNFALPVEYLSRLLASSSKAKGIPKISFGKGNAVAFSNQKPVQVGSKIEWVSVLKNKAKVYSRPSLKANVLRTMPSLKTLVFIEKATAGGSAMILVGEYLGQGEAKKIGWISSDDLL